MTSPAERGRHAARPQARGSRRCGTRPRGSRSGGDGARHQRARDDLRHRRRHDRRSWRRRSDLRLRRPGRRQRRRRLRPHRPGMGNDVVRARDGRLDSIVRPRQGHRHRGRKRLGTGLRDRAPGRPCRRLPASALPGGAREPEAGHPWVGNGRRRSGPRDRGLHRAQRSPWRDDRLLTSPPSRRRRTASSSPNRVVRRRGGAAGRLPARLRGERVGRDAPGAARVERRACPCRLAHQPEPRHPG